MAFKVVYVGTWESLARLTGLKRVSGGISRKTEERCSRGFRELRGVSETLQVDSGRSRSLKGFLWGLGGVRKCSKGSQGRLMGSQSD